ncbi:MAG: hypothetical protein A2X94_08695 [Bdellovibrionales bacterium GWB1_55_8]|nr:MAG: hypothetical protein A2X94_08695 [Bdellovibrionales bacterium GWB1_55_8]
MTRFEFRYIVGWYFLPAIVVAMTVIAWMLSKHVIDQEIDVEFDMISTGIEQAVQNRMQDYVQSLVQATGFIALSEKVTREEFRGYVKKIDTEKFFPGIQGIGLAVYLRNNNLMQHIKAGRESGIPDYDVSPEGTREEYLPILYLEPLNKRNRAAIGYDMMSEAIRKAAIVRARDTGEPSLSDMVTLVQEIDEKVQPGFLLYVPVYREGAPIRTVAERRAAFLGHVYSPFRAHDLFNALFSGQHPPVGFKIYSGSEINEDKLLYSLPRESERFIKTSGLTRTVPLEIGEHTWTFQFFELPQLKQNNPYYLPFTVLIGGILLSLFSLRVAFDNKTRMEAREAALNREQRLRSQIQQKADENAKLYENASAAVAARNELLAIVSHDLRNPLNAILLNSRLLQKAGSKPNIEPRELEQLAIRIQRSGDRMNQLIQDLLDIAQIESGSLPITPQPQSAARLVSESLEALRPLASEKSIDLRAEIPEDHPILADAKRILQVLSNLIGNALKFTPEGGSIVIHVGREASNSVLFSVSDTGKGIFQEDLPRVFQRFWGKDKSRGGTGLGLFIVEQIVRAHGGRIWVESPEGRGTTFWFTLPAAPEPARAQ